MANLVAAETFGVSSSHRLAREAGVAILQAGGHAVNVGVADGMALGVLHSDLVNASGAAPMIFHMADTAIG